MGWPTLSVPGLESAVETQTWVAVRGQGAADLWRNLAVTAANERLAADVLTRHTVSGSPLFPVISGVLYRSSSANMCCAFGRAPVSPFRTYMRPPPAKRRGPPPLLARLLNSLALSCGVAIGQHEKNGLYLLLIYEAAFCLVALVHFKEEVWLLAAFRIVLLN